MTPHQLSDAVLAALGGLVRRGALELSGELAEAVVVERPKVRTHGDYATNVALQLAGSARVAPLGLAELLAQELITVDGVASVSTAGPGFVNVTVSSAALVAVAAQVVAAGPSYGAADVAFGSPVAEPAAGSVGRLGVDAARYALARRPPGSSPSADVEKFTRASVDNPLYAVQYAHSRLASLLRNAADLGVEAGCSDPALLDHPRERDLLGALAEYPAVVATAARLREQHRVVRHLEDTVATFHRFSDSCRTLPQGDEEPTELHRARLLLVAATRIVVANGLHLLGVSAPERM